MLIAAVAGCPLGRGPRPGWTGGIPNAPAMPIVTVQQGPRGIELKRERVKQITDAFVDAYKIPAESAHVWIHETPAATSRSAPRPGRATATAPPAAPPPPPPGVCARPVCAWRSAGSP
ncbi:tautomerase family protein [Streptomyces sp. NPDC046465]|uniref:tautomerase family protein n=1 Tax=Streptomyces sp. NPDC046465 TaxID=3155810 RepID=UPI0033F6DA0B